VGPDLGASVRSADVEETAEDETASDPNGGMGVDVRVSAQVGSEIATATAYWDWEDETGA